MNGTREFDWVEFYKELARKLLDYRNNREELITSVRQVFEKTGLGMPTLDRENKLVDIDPFTFFGLFNKSSMKNSNRTAIITAVKEVLGIEAPVPTSFSSIPVLNNQNATFYDFIDQRNEHDIDDLWDLFVSAIAYASNPTPENRGPLAKFFDLAINKKGNGNSKITMGLYWIAPESFLNLDKRNTWFIYESGRMPGEFVSTLPVIDDKIPSKKYFDIVEKLKAFIQSGKSEFNDFMELSQEAWRYSDQINKENAAKKAEIQRENTGSALADEGVKTIHYWIYSPGDNASFWDEFYDSGIMAIGPDGIGDLSQYESKSDMKKAMQEKFDPEKSYKNDAHATWQFANEMKPGDIVFAKKGMRLVIGRGIIESDYEFHPERRQYEHVRKVKWTDKGEWQHPGQAVMKVLTDITKYKDYVEKLNTLFESDSDKDTVGEVQMQLEPYSEDMFLDQVYMDKEKYETLVNLLMKKKNVILQGAPGVGKTYAAKRLAYSIMGVKDPSRVMMVQFHQSYSYEDFIMGYRPKQDGGFELKHGPFYDFCKSAEEDGEDVPYFFIIDEINRGNLSKIFGELFMLIESDKRGIGLRLLYNDEEFSVPKNVYIVGMMNTADRSLAMMDYALRRRFAFFSMDPGFDTAGFRKYRDALDSEKFDKLVACVERLNVAIENDESLGEGFRIGHSYFCNLTDTLDRTLSGIVEFELIPLLKEYWFDEPTKINDWSRNLRDSIK